MLRNRGEVSVQGHRASGYGGRVEPQAAYTQTWALYPCAVLDLVCFYFKLQYVAVSEMWSPFIDLSPTFEKQKWKKRKSIAKVKCAFVKLLREM